MNSEKGNLISLIKEFINKIKLFFKHKKEQLELLMKKRKEEKKQKINNEKQYNKLFVGVKTFLGYIISVIGGFFTKKNKQPKEVNIEKELKHINRNILNIEKEIEHETTPLILKMYKKQINKNIEKMKNLKNVKSREDKNLNDFFEVQEQINTEQEEVIEEKNEQKEEVKHYDTESYLGVLEIKKIGLTKGFYSINSKNNRVNKTIQIIKESKMPDEEKGNLIIAGHSVNAYISYFRNLNKLSYGDIATIYYNGRTYNYKLVNTYEIEKADYLIQVEKINKEVSALEDEIELCNSKYLEKIKKIKKNDYWINHFKRNKKISHLTKEILNELIDTIYVYENGNIKIIFKYQEEYNAIVNYVGTEGVDQLCQNGMLEYI